jgi:polysaccharide pyruvyl transferase WcaK-like protein
VASLRGADPFRSSALLMAEGSYDAVDSVMSLSADQRYMTAVGAGCKIESTSSGELRETAGISRDPRHEGPPGFPRIALLTPYNGENLGDASIQHAIITNLHLRLPNAEFSGVTMSDANFVEQHGRSGFPLYAGPRPFFASRRRKTTDRPGAEGSAQAVSPTRFTSLIRKLIRSTTAIARPVKAARGLAERLYGELLHALQAYRFLRTHHVLIVSGGGQLDEEWGGPWGHPYILLKWAVLARIARVPFAIASVGACKVSTPTCRILLSATLRMARYRSYRDINTRRIAARLWRRAAGDPVVPDMAFSLPSSELPPPAPIRQISRGRPVVAISPIAYGKAGAWPYENAALYSRYLQELVGITSQLLQRDYFLLFVYSCLGADDPLVSEILQRLDEDSRRRAARQTHVSAIRTWKDLIAQLRDADFLIASRLHSTILAFVAQTPTVAISFDPKVDWVMQDLGQTDYLLHIQDFTARDVIRALERVKQQKDCVTNQLRCYPLGIQSAFARQYDALARLAIASRKRRS